MVYENCKIYGPYSSKDKRLRCVIVHNNGQKQTISYPKYLMEIHLDRYLEENETIDHIDGNFLNNDLSNLRVLDRRQHCKEDALRNEDIEVECACCHKIFTIKGTCLVGRNRKDKHQSGYFCSKTCRGKYGKEIQLGLRNLTIVDKIVPNKYRVKSAQGETFDVEMG